MNGHPLTRATSPDGRWAYTLYEGAAHPFIHALDTSGRSARCIDLDWLHGRKDLWRLRFALKRDGRQLSVRSGARSVAVVDTRSFRASASGSVGGGRDWTGLWLGGLGLAALLAGGLLYAARTRRRPAA
jgi:hypothetical protein